MPEPQPVGYFLDPKGEVYNFPLSSYGQTLSPLVNNLRIDPLTNRYRTRDGTEIFGTAASTYVVGLAIFTTVQGNDYPIRVTTTGVSIWSGGTWVALSGPVLALNNWDYIEFSVWGTKMMFTDGVSGLYLIDLTANTYALISTAPIGLHLTTFNGRVILSYIVKDTAANGASGTQSTRIRWCVKNDNIDWDGEGSGYEDLLSAPGGVVDIQHAVIPMTDADAFVIRSSSIWIMSTTGFFDTPFAFVQRFNQGTDAPRTVVRVPSTESRNIHPSQIMLLGNDDVLLVGPDSVEEVGLPIRDQLINSSLDVSRAVAGYEPKMREYRIHVPPYTDANTESVVFRYNIDKGTWVHDTLPYQLRRMAFKDLRAVLSFDQLTGTMDSLSGSMDALGVSARSPGMIFSTGPDKYVVKEDSTKTFDVGISGFEAGIPIEIRTGDILPTGPLNTTQALKVQLEYEASRVVTVQFDYSIDQGTTWQSYGTLSLAITTGSTIVVYRYNREATRMMFRLTSTNAGGLQVHGFDVTTVRGAEINE